MIHTQKIKINQGRFLPLWLRLILAAFWFAAIIYLIGSLQRELAVGISLLLATPVFPLWNSFILLEIHNSAKKYKKGIWIAGLALGKWIKYEKVLDIKIRKTSLEKRVLWTGKPYEAFLLLDDETQVYLLGDSSQEVLQEKLREISGKLGLELEN